MNDMLVKKILSETESGYDLMADKFSQTRKHFWRDLEFIKDYAKDGDRILDYGCGNGRLLELLNGLDTEYFGVDISQKLIEVASSRYQGSKIHFQKIGSSQVILPFSDSYFNTIYCIAVFHHIPDSQYRLSLIKELQRVLEPGGHIIITVWNLWQRKYIKNIINNWLDKLTGKSNLDWNDCYIAFTNNFGEVFKRYHHAFSARELKKDFKCAGFQVKMCRIMKGRNIVLVGKK